MDKIRADLATAIKTNFSLLGLNINDPSVVCDCHITPGSGGATVPAVSSTNVAPQVSIASQFIEGGSTLTGPVPLSHVDPGNVPFILPTGVETIVAQQQSDAQKALKVAQDAAAEAAKKLSPTPVSVTVSAPSLAVNTTATATATASTVAAANTVPIAANTSDTSSDTIAQPAPVIEPFAPRHGDWPPRRLRMNPWDTRQQKKSGGGWGLCGQLSFAQLVSFIVSVAIAWYVLLRVRRRE